MAAHPIVIVHDGIVEIPEDLKQDPRFGDGARLQLVPLKQGDGDARTSEAAWGAFRATQGIFADAPGDGNASLQAERRLELGRESR